MFVLILILCLNIFAANNAEIINKSVERNVNLKSQLVKIYTKITFTKFGIFPEQNYSYLLSPGVEDYYVSFAMGDASLLSYNISLIELENNTVTVFIVNFPKEFVNGESVELNVEEVHINKIMKFVKTIPFGEPEIVGYQTNLHFFSQYKTQEFSVLYKLFNIYHASIPPTKQITNLKDIKLIYNFVDTLEAFSHKPLFMEFVFIKTFFSVLNLHRTIDVSHFGKIFIEETVEIKNKGANVIGSYKESKEKIRWFHTHLPASAEDISIFDDIGVLYEEELIDFPNHRTLKFRTRYPLLGGWKTKHTIRYSVPTHQYLSTFNDSKYQLKMRIFDHVLNDIVIEEFKTKIILPEYAEYYYNFVPEKFVKLDDEFTITHLTCYNRRSILISGRNVIENHIDDFIVEYDFDDVYLLRVPFKLAAFLFSLFLFFIALRRMSSFYTLK